MPTCPRCRVPLLKQKIDAGTVHSCAKCGGRSINLFLLRRLGADATFLRFLWDSARGRDAPHLFRCPHCNRPMRHVVLRFGDETPAMDVCPSCTAVWFDPGELGYATQARRSLDEEALPIEVRRQLALLKMQMDAAAAAASEEASAPRDEPQQWWQWLLLIKGLPVEDNPRPLRTWPWATWGTVALVIVFSSIAALWDLPWVIAQGGFIPNAWFRKGGLTLLSSFFIHGGFYHLVGNMYFLLIFGDNVEDDLGWRKFLLLLLVGHLAGAAFHAAYDPRGDVPLIGASAGISAVLAYYAVAFPYARIDPGLGWLSLLYNFRMPAWMGLLVFTLFQVSGILFQLAGETTTSHLGHVGGLAAGLSVGAWVRLMRQPFPLPE